jgi:metal-sulfur cluster biosynthetic enzyme
VTAPHTTLQERPKPGWVEPAKAAATPDELRLWTALEDVADPEYPVSVVDMGLIYGLQHRERLAAVKLTFTSMGCPCMEFIVDDIRQRLLEEPDVDEVTLEIVWDPPWTRNRLSERAIEKLKSWGVRA